MPPRIALRSCLGIQTLCLRHAVKPPLCGPLPLAFIVNASSQAQKRKNRDPYALAQARQRKAANVRRQEELRMEREEAMGDPVRGITTPFVESFDIAAPLPTTDGKAGATETMSKDLANSTLKAPLNYYLKPSELEQSLQHSYILTQPLVSTTRDLRDPEDEAEAIRGHAEAHERATEAVARIVNLANGNQEDRTRANVQRCIETFGRHNTDKILRPKGASHQKSAENSTPQAEKTPRAGPDTGSSEVQIAILTAKIRVLANMLEKPGCQKDKMNKRNLRMLVHRRQKLLTYLRRKERGSERWQNIVATLGLTEGTWKGEISL